MSVTAVAVSAGTARGEPSPPAAVDAARPAVPTRRWIKWAVGAAIGAGVVYTVVFSASSFADAVGSLAEARFGWAAVGIACEAASFLLLGLLVHRLLGAEAGVSRRATVGVGLVLTGLGNVLPAAPAEGLALASGELHRRGVQTRRVRLALAFSEWYTTRAAFALVAINAVVIAAIVQFRVGGGLARLGVLRTRRRRSARRPRAHRVARQPAPDRRVGSRRPGSAPILEARSTERRPARRGCIVVVRRPRGPRQPAEPNGRRAGRRGVNRVRRPLLRLRVVGRRHPPPPR